MVCARLVLALGLCAALAACGAQPPAGPVVLLVTIDTLRADRLGSYGYTLDTSPEFDRLAEGGVLFERAVAGSSATAPSHASILSSRFTREHSVGYENGSTRLEGVDTIATLFHDAGYATAAFVGNVVLRRGQGFEAGFDVYDDELPKSEGNRDWVFERIAEETAVRALAWIEAHRGEPYFLWVHLQDPHGPYAPPAAYAGRFRVPPHEREAPLPVLEDDGGIGGIPAYQVLGEIRRPSVYEGRYADEIFYADLWLGRLVDAVEQSAGERGAVVLMTADHGESFGEDDHYYVHQRTTPEVAHVPLVVRAPGLAPGRRGGLVHHVDILPTLLELAGRPVPADARGIALGPLLRGGAPLPERILFTDIGGELSAYSADAFLRVQGVEGAWSAEPGRKSLAPRWQSYAWAGDGSWKLVREERVPIAAVSAYFSKAVPMVHGRRLSDQVKARLRALGYGSD